MKVSKNLMLSLLACLSASNQISLGMMAAIEAEQAENTLQNTVQKTVTFASQENLSYKQLKQKTKTLKANIAKQQKANIGLAIQVAVDERQNNGGPVVERAVLKSKIPSQSQIYYQQTLNIELNDLLNDVLNIQDKLNQRINSLNNPNVVAL